MAGMIRGAGYCTNRGCADYSIRIFLPGPGEKFNCSTCGQEGRVERERGTSAGNSDIYNEVRVDWSFDSEHGCYRSITRIKDDSIRGRHGVYTLQSPLIDSEEKALKVAQAILKNLNRCRGPMRRSAYRSVRPSRELKLVNAKTRRPDRGSTSYLMTSRRAIEAC